jgi:hypothetical protein
LPARRPVHGPESDEGGAKAGPSLGPANGKDCQRAVGNVYGVKDTLGSLGWQGMGGHGQPNGRLFLTYMGLYGVPEMGESSSFGFTGPKLAHGTPN